MKLLTIRYLSRSEVPWLSHDIPEGTSFFKASDVYNTMSNNCVAVSVRKDGFPYFAIPKDSVRENFHLVFSDN